MPKTPEQIDLSKASVSCNVCHDAGAPVVFQEDGLEHGDGAHHDHGCYRVVASAGADDEVLFVPPAEPGGAETPLLFLIELGDEAGPQCGVSAHPCPPECYVRQSVERFNEHSATHTQAEHNAAASKRNLPEA